jgi:hypothetical protein
MGLVGFCLFVAAIVLHFVIVMVAVARRDGTSPFTRQFWL